MDRIDLPINDPLPDLKARFSIKRGLFRRESVESCVFSLDQYGCLLKTDKALEAGDNLQFDLVMTMPFEDIVADALDGLVVDVRKHCSNFFYSIDFDTFDKRSSSQMKAKMARIRDVLYRKQTLRSRRAG